MSSKLAALPGSQFCQLTKDIDNLDEPSSVEAADEQNAMLVNWGAQQE
jgi:hypothetical protein